jgi:predicted Zn-dependent protease
MERAVELFPNWEIHLAFLGNLLAQEGRIVPAVQMINRAMRLNPRAPSMVLINVAFVNIVAGRREKAAEQLESVRTANPDHIASRALLAAYYEREGLHDQASAAVAEILRITPDFSVATAREMGAGFENAIGPEEFAAYMEALGEAGLPE